MSTPNPKRDAFARHWFSGLSAHDAAKAAGYGGDAAALRRTAGRLMKDPAVLAAYEEMKRIANKGAAFTRDEAIAYLSRVMRFDMGDVLNNEGTIDLERVRQYEATGLIVGVKRRENQFGENVTIDFADKDAALSRLMELNGWVVHRFEETRKDVVEMTDAELEAAVLEFAKSKKGSA